MSDPPFTAGFPPCFALAFEETQPYTYLSSSIHSFYTALHLAPLSSSRSDTTLAKFSRQSPYLVPTRTLPATMSSMAMSYYPAGTPAFEPASPCFEDRTHPASLTVCGIHNPALLELIRTEVSREMVCKLYHAS